MKIRGNKIMKIYIALFCSIIVMCGMIGCGNGVPDADSPNVKATLTKLAKQVFINATDKTYGENTIWTNCADATVTVSTDNIRVDKIDESISKAYYSVDLIFHYKNIKKDVLPAKFSVQQVKDGVMVQIFDVGQLNVSNTLPSRIDPKKWNH
jgi:hypothetical protein